MSSAIGPRILFITRSLNIGGAERQLIELAGGLQRAGFSVKLATFYSGGALEPLLASHGVPLLPLRKRGRWDVFGFTVRLLRCVREERPDVLYSMLTTSNLLVALLRPFFGGTRVAWGVATSQMDLSYYDWLAKLEAALEVRLANRADLIICNSHAGRTHHVARGYPPRRTLVIPNGIDIGRFKPDPDARAEMRTQWRIGAATRVVGLVGRLDPIKDHPTFLRAAAIVARTRPDVRFVCVGDGPADYRGTLLALGERLGLAQLLTWVGECPDVWRIYNGLDVGVSSSISEGLANVVAEAMATGVPCVATTVGDSADLVTNRRWLCAPRDSAALAEAIGNALDDLPVDTAALRGEIASRYGNAALVSRTAEALADLVRSEERAITSRPYDEPRDGSPSILFLIRKLDIGGAQRQLVELAAGLHAHGWKVVVATFYAGGALASRLDEAGVPIVSLGKRARWDLWGPVWRLARLVRYQRPQLLHGYLDSSNILLTLLSPCLPRARLVWGVRASNMDLGHYDAAARLESKVAALLSRFADLVICNSQAGREHHRLLGYPEARMTVIPNGVDTGRFRPDTCARAAVRNEWHIGSAEKLVGVVARLDPMKDHRTFLAAAATVATRRPQVRFVCIGEGPAQYRDTLNETARVAGLGAKLIWAGARHDMPRVYNALDVLVSSSAFGEGFPNTIVEGMATGVPCVVTDVGDSAAIVDELGWVCPPGDSAALADAIVEAIDSPCNADVLRARVTGTYASAALVERTLARLAPLVLTGEPAVDRIGARP